MPAETVPTGLFDPITLRGARVRNRLWVAPMCMYAVDALDGVPNDWHLVHLPSMARGGAGLVVAEATAVVPEGRISPRDLGLWNATQQSAFARIAELVHAAGAAFAIQLAHAGRKASTHPALPGFPRGSVARDDGGWETVAASAVPFGDFAEPRGLDRDEIPGLIVAWRHAANRAVDAGVDAVEVHAAHGYLLHEFLSPLSNHRHDEYGGTLENRSRILLDIVRAIRGDHPDLPILVRLSATEWTEGGFDLEQSQRVTTWLADAGADLVDVSSAGNLPAADIPVGPAYQAPLAQALRGRGLPVSAVGLITDAVQAQSLLTTGAADVITVGRPWLRNPYLGLGWAQDLAADSRDPLQPPQLWRARPPAR